MSMPYFAIPESNDLPAVIADLFDCLVDEPEHQARRDQIIGDCLDLFEQQTRLIEALQSKSSVELRIFREYLWNLHVATYERLG